MVAFGTLRPQFEYLGSGDTGRVGGALSRDRLVTEVYIERELKTAEHFAIVGNSGGYVNKLVVTFLQRFVKTQGLDLMI